MRRASASASSRSTPRTASSAARIPSRARSSSASRLRHPRVEGDRAVVALGRLQLGRPFELLEARLHLAAAHEQQLPALLGERELLAEGERLLGQLTLAPLRAIELGTRVGDRARGGGDAGREGSRRSLGGGERLGALVVSRAGGRERLVGEPQLRLVVGLEGGAELAVQLAEAGRPHRLALELAEPRRELADHHADVAEVVAGLGQPPLGAVQLHAVAVDVGGLLDQLAPLDRAQPQHLVDQALRHHRVRVLADLGAEEEVVDVEQPHLLAVDAVLVLPGAVGPAGDADLVEVDRHPVLGVVEDQRDLGDAEGGALVRAGKDQVLGLARAHRPR